MAKKKFNITLPMEDYEDLQRFAISRGDDTATRAALFVQQALTDLRKSGQIPTRPSVESIVKRLEEGEWVPDKDLTIAAHNTKISIEVLKTIRQCLTKNGGKSSVHTH